MLKTASADETSRATGVGLGVYEREVRFYRELAPRIGGPLAECHVAVIDPAERLVHDPARGRRAGACRAIRSPAAASSRRASRSRSSRKLHAPRVRRLAARRDPVAQPGEPAQPGDARAAAARVPRALRRPRQPTSTSEVCTRSSRASTAGSPIGAHRSGWCTATTGSTTCCSASTTPRAGSSVGRLADRRVGSGDDRRLATSSAARCRLRTAAPHERELVRGYYETLHAHGVRGYSAGRSAGRATAARPSSASLMTVAPAMIVERTERGDEMFLTCARALRPAGARPRRDRAAAGARKRATAGAAPGARRRGPPCGGPRAAVERELVLRRDLRGRAARRCTRDSACTRTWASAWVTAFVCGPEPPDGRGDRLRRTAARGRGAERPDDGAQPASRCASAPLERYRVRLRRSRRGATPILPALLRGEPGRAGRGGVRPRVGDARRSLCLPRDDAL